MRFPVKACVRGAPGWFYKVVKIAVRANPRDLLDFSPDIANTSEGCIAFSQSVVLLSWGATTKTTQSGRHPQTDELIRRVCENSKPVILDVGVSDGITSAELIKTLGNNFGKYFATDVSFRARCIERDGEVYFYDTSGNCVLMAGPRLLAYSHTAGAVFPFGWNAERLLARAPVYRDAEAKEICLANPALRKLAEQDERVTICEHNLFERWAGIAPDVIKVANVLNRSSFADDDLARAVANLKDVLVEGGHLFLTDNRHIEKVSMFVKGGSRLELKETVSGGSEIADLVRAV